MLLKSSFGGRSCTSVVVNVASEAQYGDESLCSLRFGQRMTRVTNKAIVVVGDEAQQSLEQAQRQLDQARSQLQEMKEAGAGERFGASAPASEVRTFQETITKLRGAQGQLLRAKQQLTEANAANAASGSAHGSSGAGSLQQQVQKLQAHVDNLRMILLRQKSIKGLWFNSTRGFKQKQAEVKDLETQVRVMQTAM